METQRNEPEFMTVDEVAKLFRVSTSTVRRWLHKGLPHMRVGNTLRFHRDEVVEWGKGEAA